MGEFMENKEEFKRIKKVNYRCSFLAMLVTQILLFSFNMSMFANVVGYFVNLFGWIIVGCVLECIVAVKCGVDLNKNK